MGQLAAVNYGKSSYDCSETVDWWIHLVSVDWCPFLICLMSLVVEISWLGNQVDFHPRVVFLVHLTAQHHQVP